MSSRIYTALQCQRLYLIDFPLNIIYHFADYLYKITLRDIIQQDTGGRIHDS